MSKPCFKNHIKELTFRVMGSLVKMASTESGGLPGGSRQFKTYVEVNEPCPLCLDNITEVSYANILPCGHMFHYICLFQLLIKGFFTRNPGPDPSTSGFYRPAAASTSQHVETTSTRGVKGYSCKCIICRRETSRYAYDDHNRLVMLARHIPISEALQIINAQWDKVKDRFYNGNTGSGHYYQAARFVDLNSNEVERHLATLWKIRTLISREDI